MRQAALHRLSFIVLAVSLVNSPVAAFGECDDGCATVKRPMPLEKNDGTYPLYGVSDVTVYLNEEARQHHRDSEKIDAIFDMGRVRDAFAQWTGECADIGGMPTFRFDFENAVPLDRDKKTTISIIYDPDEGDDQSSKNSPEERAEARGTEIILYGKCKNNKSNCDAQSRFLWGSDYGQQIIAHEIGHVLGVGHDKSRKEGCDKQGLMAGASWPDTPLELKDEYCQMAKKVNDPYEGCSFDAQALGGDVHPCELCQYELSASVSGLRGADSVSLVVTLPANGYGIYKTVYSDSTFTFDARIPDQFEFEVTATPSSSELVCTVENGSGVINGADVDSVRIVCECSVALCQGPGDEGAEEPTRISRYDICFDFPALCSVTGLDPWWHNGPGPGTGGSPCQRQTHCTDLGVDCSEFAADGTPICSNRLKCDDACVPTATLALKGPAVFIDDFEAQAVSGRLLLTGFARDPDGLRDLRLYLDGELLAPASLDTAVLRGDACDGVAGDCDPFSGFAVELDSLDWVDGAHLLEIIAIDGEPDHPMATVVEREIVVDNTCTATSPPTVSVTAPAAGDLVAGPVPISASAQAEAGVERVQFFVDDARLASDWSAPYQWTWDSTTAEDGFHEIRARVTDRCGGVAHSQLVVVESINDNEPPMVELENPLPGATISGPAVEVSGWALDEDGVDSIAVRLNGQLVTTTGPLEVRTRSEICSSVAIADPRCPDVGWALALDSERYADGPYQLEVVVSDNRGGVQTIARQVDIGNNPPQPPGVSTPTSVNGVVGDTVTFQVHAWGEGPHAFQWQERDGGRWLNLWDGARDARISGVTTDSLTISDLGFSDAGGYRCLVSNAGGATASPSASLTVAEAIDAPTVVAGIDQTAAEGTDVNLTVSAEGAGTLTYQWQKWTGTYYADVSNGNGIAGAHSPVLAFTAVDLGADGRYRCEVSNAGGTTPSTDIVLTVAPDLSGSCGSTSTTLCLQQSRFQVEAVINGAAGQAKPYSNLGGFFTRSNPENVEVGVKVLDGVYINGRYWVFHGSMTSLPYTVIVTDTATGAVKSYHKDSDSFCGEADTEAFANPTSGSSALVAGSFIRLRASEGSTSGSCEGSPTAQCLLADRFRVQVFRNGNAQQAVPVTGLSAAFTFGSTANPEVLVKVLDGTPVNNWYWVFFGSLTSQDYEVRVTDTTDGSVKTYPSPGPSCGQADTNAF